ncbi:MAG: hypothetical protein K0R87_3448, partial [Pseudonocardia sp.]|nr:hypothetical protein [Pseudonocardia sp.]
NQCAPALAGHPTRSNAHADGPLIGPSLNGTATCVRRGVLDDHPKPDRSPSDPLLFEVRGGMIGAWRDKAQRSMGPPAVVVGAVLGESC